MPIITIDNEETPITSVQNSSFRAEVEHIYKVDPTNGNITVDLPTASGYDGKDIVLAVTYSGTNHVLVVPSGSETVGRRLDLRLETFDSVMLTSDGVSDWVPIGIPEPPSVVPVTTVQTSSFRAEPGRLYQIDTTGGDITVDLPTALDYNGKDLTLSVVSSGNNYAYVVPSGSETVGRQESLRLETYDSVKLTSNGNTDWVPIGPPFATTSRAKRESFGHMYVTASGLVAVTGGADYIKAGGTTALLMANRFDMPENNRLRYICRCRKMFGIDLSGSASINAANCLVHVAIFHNGVMLLDGEQDFSITNSLDHNTFFMHTMAIMDTNDYLEVYVKSSKNGNLNTDHMTLMVRELQEW